MVPGFVGKKEVSILARNHDASLSPVVLRVCTLDRTWRRERASAFLPTTSLRRAVVSAVRGAGGSSVSLAWKRRRG